MAKPSAPAPVAAPAMVLPPSKPSVASRTAAVQSIADIRDVDVLEWGNGEAVEPGSQPAMAREGNLADDKAFRVTPQRGEPDFEGEPAVGKREVPLSDEAEEPAPKADAKPAGETPAEKRQRGLDSLAAEKRARSLEAELKTERTRREAGEKLTLGELLKARGVNKDDLLEKLLTGADDLGLPAKLEPAAEEAAKRDQRIADLEAKLASREKADEERAIADGLRVVTESLKDVGVPLVESTSAYQHVMNEAYDLWVKAGKEGVASEHLPQAAANVEAKLRKQYPKLAALADAAEKGKEPTPAEKVAAFAPAPRPGITRRTGARPGGEPTKLPLDNDERDKIIKAEHGWT